MMKNILFRVGTVLNPVIRGGIVISISCKNRLVVFFGKFIANSESSFRQFAGVLITLILVVAAIWGAIRMWDYYELEPWTRDGRVRADVIQIAPDVTGLVTHVLIRDNQQVKAGDLLFEVDSERYALALRNAQANLAAQRVALAQVQREDARNAGLGKLVSQEMREQTNERVDQSAAAVAQAEVAIALAKLNLERAQVRAPRDGQVTNLELHQGSYATAGHAVLALVDARSFYVEGYFEETKLPRINIGDKVKVKLMSGGRLLTGKVDSIVAGISDQDRSTSANLLPSVNPTFNWVRLPERVPVRIQLDPVPKDFRLVAGQTVTVQVINKADN